MPAAPLPLMGLNLSAGNGIDARWRESISISAEKYRHAARQWVSLRRIWHSLRGYRASPSPKGGGAVVPRAGQAPQDVQDLRLHPGRSRAGGFRCARREPRFPAQGTSTGFLPTFFRCCGFPSVCRGWLAGRVRCSQRDRFFSEWDGPCRCCGARRFLWAGSRCSIRKRNRWPFGYHETFLSTAFRDFGTFLRLAGNALS